MGVHTNSWGGVKDAWRVAVLRPPQDHAELGEYGHNVERGFLLGLKEIHSDVEVKCIDTIEVDSNTGKTEIVAARLLNEIHPLPDVCVGVIRSDVAPHVVGFCEAKSRPFIGTDHAATRLALGGREKTHWYFRVSRVADQMIDSALHVFCRRTDPPHRLLLVAADYPWGKSFVEEVLRVVAETDLRIGITDSIAFPFDDPEDDQTELYADLRTRIMRRSPDGVIVGLWGQQLNRFLLETLAEGDYKPSPPIPFVIPEAGWDYPACGFAFPPHSVLGARYYIPMHEPPELDDGPLSLGPLSDLQLRRGCRPTYQAAASYAAGKLLATTFDDDELDQAHCDMAELRKRIKDAGALSLSGLGPPVMKKFEDKDCGEWRLQHDHCVAVTKSGDRNALFNDVTAWDFVQP